MQAQQTILVTGGAGFIGSNYIRYKLKTDPECIIVNLDLLTYAGNLQNLGEYQEHPRHIFIKGDIADRRLVKQIFEEYSIGGVINFAAESHVDNSIADPEVFIRTNVNGTFNLLDVAYKKWMSAPFQYRVANNQRFHQISTDEVYGSLGETGLFSENMAYAPNSPYSASKAAADMIVRSYHHTYGMNTVITNCSNNYGPGQHDEKLIPTIIRKALTGDKIPIYGDGKNIRDWLFVEDHVKGIELAFYKGKAGEVYNIGGGNERTNNEIVENLCRLLDKLQSNGRQTYLEQVQFVEDRAGHDKRYAIDASKIEKDLGWNAEEDFASGLLKTVQWYIEKYR